MDEDLREAIALFRYGVISELLTRTLQPGEKERLLQAIHDKEWEIPGTTRRRIGRSTARSWIRQYQTDGLEGLKPLGRKDAGRSRCIPEEIQDLLLRLREERPEASVVRLVDIVRLAASPPVPRLSLSSVYRFFAQHPREPRQPSGTPTQADARAFTHAHVNDLWMCDAMHGPRLLAPGRARGEKTYLIALIDDASRLVPHAAFYRSENAACLIDALRHGFLRRGIPRRFYCDNGAAFRTRHLELVCATLNVILIHSRPHKPRGRGKVERFFRRVRSAFLPLLDPQHLEDLAALNRVFWAWLEGEYHVSPHQGLGKDQSPLDRFLLDQALIRAAPDDLERLLRMKVTRRVARDRTVRLEGRIYEAPDGYAGETVDILYDPYDPTADVHMRRRGQREEVRLRLLDALGNARRRPRRAGENPSQDQTTPPPPTGISYLEMLAQHHFDSKDKP